VSNPRDEYQCYECPQEFQERLTEVGGRNRYDQPNFLVVWGQGGQDECLYRAGGHWHVDGEVSFKGYRDLLVGGGTPSWCLLQWQDAINFGTPESFYVSMLDDETNLSDLGEYPYRGKYVLLYNMCWRDMQDGKMKIEAMPLNSFILNFVVPIILEARDISWAKTQEAMKGIKEKEDAADMTMVEDAMRDASVAFKGPVSYARQGCRTHFIDKKVEAMTKNWNKMVTNARTLGRGLSTQAEDSRLTQDFLRNKIQK
jgi:hypothetical protein